MAARTPGRTGTVAVFVLCPIATAERSRFSGEEARTIEEVARLPTLNELSPREARSAFWAGERLALEYLPAIARAAGLKDPPRLPVVPPP